MRRIIYFSLLMGFMIIVAGCENIDVSQISDEDLSRITKQVIICDEPYIRFETGCCLDEDKDNICDTDERVSDTGESVSQETTAESSECVPYECVYQDYAGGIRDCGIIDDGCGGTINCRFQDYAGGLECPSEYQCVNNQCM